MRIVVMGVAGCGKSTFGQALAQACALPWIDGDDFHGAQAKAKMAAGTPLDDLDRADWLQTLVHEVRKRPQGSVLGCSALKRAYRDVLRGAGKLQFAYLSLTPEEAQRRVLNRSGHFFSEALVTSQFEALEDPSAESDVWVLDATYPLAHLVKQCIANLQASARSNRDYTNPDCSRYFT